MASITISRGTPFSAASWVMAVTTSLFLLACPPLLDCYRRRPPQQKKWGLPTPKRSFRRRLHLAVPSPSISQGLPELRRKNGLRFDPFIVGFDEVNQALVGVCFGNAFFDDLFAHVEVDVAGRAADVA